MEPITPTSLPEIIDYLKQDIPNCIYLYIDLCKYGLFDHNVRFFMSEDANGINLVAMEYFNSLQLFSLSENWNMGAISELICRKKYAVVNARCSMTQRLLPLCTGYEVHNGAVFECNSHLRNMNDGIIERPREQDYCEIATLLCSDATFAHYNKDNLEQQLRERAAMNMGRSLVIRDDGKIVAHIATFAEYDGIAVTSGLIVEKSYRKLSYGPLLESALFNELQEGKYTIYTFVTEPHRVKWLKALGCRQIADYGKMIHVE